MTTLLDDILTAIGETQRDDLEIVHSFSHFSCKGDLSSPNKNLGVKLQQIFNRILINELFIVLTLTNGDQDPVKFSSNNIDKFEERAADFFTNYDESETTKFDISSDGWSNVNIFHSSSFIDYLSKTNIKDSLNAWSTYFKENRIIINLHETFEAQSNDYVFIRSVYPNCDEKELNDWIKSLIDNNKLLNTQIERRDKVSHFVNAVQIPFIPECFDFNKPFFLKPYFDDLKSIFSLVFLSDYTNIENAIIKFKIKGYKTLSCQLNTKLPNNVNTELFDIYKWVYSEGSFIDKIGIARNVLSIHITNEDISTLEDGTCYSAQSGYDLYLKDNVKQYIEVKNKIADMLYDQSEKASAITKEIFTRFQTSTWTLISFFVLSFLSNVYAKKKTDVPILDILVLDNVIIVIGIILIIFSFGYLAFTFYDSNNDIRHLENKYKEIANRYKDLLNEQDLKKILNQSNVNDLSPECRELNYIRSKKKLHIISWIIINLCLLSLLIVPYYHVELYEIYIKLISCFFKTA